MDGDTLITRRLAVCCWLTTKEFEAGDGACSHCSISKDVGLQQLEGRCLTEEPMLLTKTTEVGGGQCQARERSQGFSHIGVGPVGACKVQGSCYRSEVHYLCYPDGKQVREGKKAPELGNGHMAELGSNSLSWSLL